MEILDERAYARTLAATGFWESVVLSDDGGNGDRGFQRQKQQQQQQMQKKEKKLSPSELDVAARNELADALMRDVLFANHHNHTNHRRGGSNSYAVDDGDTSDDESQNQNHYRRKKNESVYVKLLREVSAQRLTSFFRYFLSQCRRAGLLPSSSSSSSRNETTTTMTTTLVPLPLPHRTTDDNNDDDDEPFEAVTARMGTAAARHPDPRLRAALLMCMRRYFV